MPKTTHRSVPLDSVADNACYMGMDLALIRSGVCVIANHELHIYCINSAPLRDGSRLHYIFTELNNIIERHGNPARGVVESGAYTAGGRLFQLGASFGLAELIFAQRGLKLQSATPQQIKRFLTGNHAASKRRMVKAAQALTPLADFKYHEEDEVDAYSAALMALGAAHPETLTQRTKLESVVHMTEHETSWRP